MEYALNEIRNMEYKHEKGNTGHSPYMKSGIWDHENYPILEYRKRENMKLGTRNKVILKFELGNLHLSLGSPIIIVSFPQVRRLPRGLEVARIQRGRHINNVTS